MMSIQSRIPRVQKAGHLLPVLRLIPYKNSNVDEENGRYIAFELKTRVRQPSDATKYKKFVRKFEEGSPQEWIDMLKNLDEIWTQNSMTGGTDRASTVRALVRGESAVAFETVLQDYRVTAEGETVSISTEHVQEAFKAVTETDFPHRVLDSQRLWMNRKMFKPVELTTRRVAASINRLNNALPFFLNATEASKFSEVDLIGLLEWSLPVTWRDKFDLDGYIPTLHSKAKLIEACEAIERSEIALEKPSKEESSQNHKMVKRVASRNVALPAKKQKSVSKYYCTEHGQNPTHSTADSWTLKNRAKPQLPIQKEKKSSLNRNLRNKINLLSKKSSKKKILEMYASVIRREQVKLEDVKPPKRKMIIAPDSESDNKMSVRIISAPKKKLVKKLQKRSIDNTDGDLTGEEENNPGDESSGDEASST
jgi:hypothetical protein